MTVTLEKCPLVSLEKQFARPVSLEKHYVTPDQGTVLTTAERRAAMLYLLDTVIRARYGTPADLLIPILAEHADLVAYAALKNHQARVNVYVRSLSDVEPVKRTSRPDHAIKEFLSHLIDHDYLVLSRRSGLVLSNSGHDLRDSLLGR